MAVVSEQEANSLFCPLHFPHMNKCYAITICIVLGKVTSSLFPYFSQNKRQALCIKPLYFLTFSITFSLGPLGLAPLASLLPFMHTRVPLTLGACISFPLTQILRGLLCSHIPLSLCSKLCLFFCILLIANKHVFSKCIYCLFPSPSPSIFTAKIIS